MWDVLERARARGYATEDQENEVGISCVAVPLLRSGSAVAAVSVTAPAERMTPARVERLHEQIRSVLPPLLPAAPAPAVARSRRRRQRVVAADDGSAGRPPTDTGPPRTLLDRPAAVCHTGSASRYQRSTQRNGSRTPWTSCLPCAPRASSPSSCSTTPPHADGLAGALVAGGLPVAEVTFRTAAAQDVDPGDARPAATSWSAPARC